ncbi:hypothetical protein [Streptomyces sp. NPDC057325]|uniref:hypothetical protein n=1 Tax=unclassified Streptomyces TaxID=2593676 RepID=UPI003636CCF1
MGPDLLRAASVVDRTGESVVLCHAHHPWTALARERRNRYAEEFLPPSWASTLAEAGFAVLRSERLALPLSDVDASVLTKGERRRIRSCGITTLGGTLFDAWA